jgi:hypothetical protein
MAVSRNWANLRDFLRKSYNREVNEWFRDEPDPVPDNTTSRKNAKRACLILPKETQNSALIKTLTFRYVVQRAHLKPDVYAIPIEERDAVRRHKPQITLYFEEDSDDVEDNYRSVQGQISYRLMNEEATTISRTELTAIANRIKTEFGAGQGYIWRKGKDMASYVERAKGYDFQILCRSRTDAQELINKVLDTNNDTPDWQYLQYKENAQPSTAYPTVPGTQFVLGESYRKPRKRPIASVRFQYAYCKLWGVNKRINLYDRSFRYLDALVD